jgi:DNA-binding NtrC family response regulator
VVDDEPSVGEALIALLESAGHAARWVANAKAALVAVNDEPTDLALVDLRLGGESGLDLLDRLREARPEMSVIVMTALATIETAVDAMRRGADNFVTKPVDPARLLAIIGKGLEAESLRRRSAQLDRLGAQPAAALVAESAGMKEALRLADAVAPRGTTVLLLGETGTGKGVLARHIHDRSPRSGRPFVELNCAGLPRELTESELFGHEKGAFTGAAGRKIGLFEAADGGTLFLDEIGEMDLAVQAKLLKVLEQRRFRRVGGIAEVEVDVRLVAATHRDLPAEVAAGRFRGDLYYRLNVFAVRLPPLRERRSEILPLARQFLREQRAGDVTDEAAEILEDYAWPGNVRELRNVMERAAILCPPGRAVGPEHLPPLDVDPSGDDAADDGDGGRTLRDAERRFLEGALKTHGGNILRTARALGVSRGMLYRKIEKYGLKVE